ncbi:cytochrome b [Mangrovicoccus ximenensis]|uniref:cytochrome b n=1 Tax=Mangrovicoccus ximenensis TaxID=1911570 RepID=UPI000D36D7BA|nr:cytochrome b/b6 domain-containing protein [Mangrovicoccus ximenensis]
MSERTPILDTQDGYGLVTRILHWALAVLILWQLTGMGFKLLLGDSAVTNFFRGHHGDLGAAIFVLAVARVAWAVAMRNRRPSHGNALQRIAVKAGHGALYALIVFVPLAAILRAIGGTRGFAPFGIELAAPREVPVEWMVNLGNALHGEAGWVMAALIAGHVAMVALHEGVLRDGTLRKMAGRA